jgi:hypothetical protein
LLRSRAARSSVLDGHDRRDHDDSLMIARVVAAVTA